MEGGGLEGGSSPGHEAVKVDAEKTYRNMLERKQVQLAKEAKFERRCMALTKRFLKSHEESIKEKQARDNEASQKNYERNMQKVADSLQADNLLRQMVKEERNQISQLMHEKAMQREHEKEKKAEKEAERNYLIQARICYDQQQAEKRHKKVEEDTTRRDEARKERMEKHRCVTEENQKTDLEARKVNEDKFNASMAKVAERNKKREIEYRQDRHEKLSARAQKQRDASEVREKRNEQVRQAAREATDKWTQKVEQRRQEDEDRIKHKAQQIVDKAQAVEERLKESRQEAMSARDQRSQNSSTMESRKPQDASPRLEERSKGPPIVPWAEDLKKSNKANTQAHKDYFQKISDLKEAEHRMRSQKRYKKLEEGARDNEEDMDTVRLRSLHNMYIAQKKPEAKDKDSPVSARSSVRPSPRQPRHGRCGLCEREYPVENLVGSALRRTVERLRHQSPKRLKSSRAGKERQAVWQQSLENADGAGHGNASGNTVITDEIVENARSDRERPGLYDYEVKLCVNCDIFVRITST
mmetsp:Transcript_28328/g.49485  ORF Transcript_28328/g.49485 Transcript_28328/m.49485 type:complete len:528 (-) Transcript_28328:114-1697(-)